MPFPWKVSAFGCTTAEEAWAPLGKGQRGSSLLFPIRGFYAKLRQGALPSLWDRAARWEISIINVRSREGRGRRNKTLSPPPPFLILLPSYALNPVADLCIKVLFSPQGSEVAGTPAGNGNTGAGRSPLLALSDASLSPSVQPHQLTWAPSCACVSGRCSALEMGSFLTAGNVGGHRSGELESEQASVC